MKSSLMGKALRQGLKPNDYLFSSNDAVLLQGHFTVLKKFSLFFLENPKIQTVVFIRGSIYRLNKHNVKTQNF